MLYQRDDKPQTLFEDPNQRYIIRDDHDLSYRQIQC
jgi:hypothetical protein